MDLCSQKFIVRGRVQGVFFRASTRAEAERLGLSGHALNLPDGTVEVLAVGEAAAIKRLAQWLRTGPPMAVVERVDAHEPQSRSMPASGFRTG